LRVMHLEGQILQMSIRGFASQMRSRVLRDRRPHQAYGTRMLLCKT
jgi:hypothetical protein